MVEVMKFYNYKLNDILDMNQLDFMTLVKAMPIVRAREKLHLLEVITYPHMKEQSQRDKSKSIVKEARPEYFKSRVNEIKTSDLARVFGETYGH